MIVINFVLSLQKFKLNILSTQIIFIFLIMVFKVFLKYFIIIILVL